MRFVYIALFFLATGAHARVFNYKDSSMAAYLRGTGALTSVGQTAFKESSGTGTSLTGKPLYAYSGEIGFMYSAGAANFRLGVELFQPKPVSEGKGETSGGTELFQLQSSVSAFIPSLTIELPFQPAGNTRMFVMAGVGYADVTVENRYKMAAPGTSAFSGVTDFDEIMNGTAISYHTGVGVETLMTDNVTVAADVGYRMLKVSSLKYKTDVSQTILSSGGVAKGDTVKNSDGSNRSLNLGGLTVGVSFRFYLNFM